jgi:hypothetical protein
MQRPSESRLSGVKGSRVQRCKQGEETMMVTMVVRRDNPESKKMQKKQRDKRQPTQSPTSRLSLDSSRPIRA